MLDPKHITAADVMTPDVLALDRDMPLSRAVAELERRHVSGAPVVDRGGRCAGVFSLADLARREAAGAVAKSARATPCFFLEGATECVDLPEDAYREALAGDTVADWMTRGVWSVRPETSLARVCRLMVREGIHRVLVLERSGRLRGIVSAFDVVRRLARRERAIREAARAKPSRPRPRPPGRRGAGAPRRRAN
jgi:CBS domain-containing protein